MAPPFDDGLLDEEELGNERQRRMVLSGQLRAAIENGDIQAYFQPLIRARDMRVESLS